MKAHSGSVSCAMTCATTLDCSSDLTVSNEDKEEAREEEEEKVEEDNEQMEDDSQELYRDDFEVTFSLERPPS
ncbi:hypothetical protein GOBAR_DD02408 [Gossypium barbadense]|nr:hypothetical protein GOBAR_DD02408 [Gossypium barbadense]